jgi:ribonucleoside-diphosphate reductase alpha chain
MCGPAYAVSARTAGRMGSHAGFEQNRDPMLGVLHKHRSAVARIDEELVPPDLLSAAQRAWDEAVELGEIHGVRNSQATVIAPTGTIGLMMDCDTTGIEPDLALTKAKKLVGGGTMFIVNNTVYRALRRIGYGDAEADAIVQYINEHKTIVGAPGLRPSDLAVFACAMGDNVIHYMGHVKMMAAVQPFISGAISKTVNMPEEASVTDIEDLYVEAWRLGLKAVAIYRDNCKVGQPLSTQKPVGAAATIDGAVGSGEVSAITLGGATVVERVVEKVVEKIVEIPVPVQQPVRQRLPRKRSSKTFSFRVADCHGYVTVGEFEDGRPGEVFLNVAKQGSTLAGIMDAFAISVSHGLQYGVPLEAFVEMFTNQRFEPAGMTDDPEIRFATSLVDYIFRRLAVEYLPYDKRVELGVLTVHERIQPTLPGVEEQTTPRHESHQLRHPELDDPLSTSSSFEPVPPSVGGGSSAGRRPIEQVICHVCGDLMKRAGTCHVCESCGATSGCS